ncbi:MAG: class I SAM-dependent methyltransferase [Gaiellaceae bacterium]
MEDWDPDTYLPEMFTEIPGYEELEEAVAGAMPRASSVLELGTGTGETALRTLAREPELRWTGIDSSAAMLARARERLPLAELLQQRLEDPLPAGPFDVVVSALAVHHLDAEGKRDLFERVAAVTETFVLGDIVTPERPEDAVIYMDGVYDIPHSVPEHLAWLDEAGFDAEATAVRPDLAVFVARRRRR